MTIYLAKTLNNMKMYGSIYDLTNEPEDRVAEFHFGIDENEWFLREHVDNVNAECNTLLDNGDVDFFDLTACTKLLTYLETIEKENIFSRYLKVLDTLKDCAEKAVQYQTGIEIEM